MSSGATHGVFGEVQVARAQLEAAARLADEQHRRAQPAHLLEALAQLLDHAARAQVHEREPGLGQHAPAGERLADGRRAASAG